MSPANVLAALLRRLKLRWPQPTLDSAIGTVHHVPVVERRPPIAFAQGRLRSLP
jgi:hypothetical protein